MSDLGEPDKRKPPFKFDLSELFARARRQFSNRFGGLTVSLPFFSFSVNPDDREQLIAREIVIRLKDRRVLSAWECCDNCIDRALESLQEIRRTLIDKQVELSGAQEGPLYLLIDMMLFGIRQFFTYVEMLEPSDDARGPHPRFPDFQRPPDTRQAYFDALELLRGHLSRCLSQIAAIASMQVPTDGLIAKYQGPWATEAYIALS
jgi:hypothetical protein